MMQLIGKHALVTGGSRGIGLEIARQLLAQGARVTLAGRDTATLVQAGASLGDADNVTTITLDVTDAQAVADGFSRAAAHFGPVDILVNNAGQAGTASFMKTDAALWQRMLDVNLTGAFNCLQAALPDMVQAGWGRVVNVASTAGLTGYRYVSAYCAAKHGLVGLTRALALELATSGVTVNAVCPGFTDTSMVEEAVGNIVAKTGRSADQARSALASGNPQQRLVQPEEVAHAVVWLCMPQSSAMNGQSITVAGGEVM
jgi:NAD(P)-dependent dehydrogenase (short-subunit alcohol dehydrogenase family)